LDFRPEYSNGRSGGRVFSQSILESVPRGVRDGLDRDDLDDPGLKRLVAKSSTLAKTLDFALRLGFGLSFDTGFPDD
jgi:hypothetical protein